MLENISVLLIDDDEDEFLLLREVFSDLSSDPDRRRYQLEWVDTYDAGLDAATKCQYDIYLIDYHLGIHNGLELFQEMVNKDCKAPAILLTGQGSYELDLRAMEKGIADYLVKDQITPFMLDRSIRYSLEQKQIQVSLEDRVLERTQALAQANTELQAEINRREMVEGALRTSEQKFRGLAESTSAAILILQDWQIQYSNPAAKFISGYEPEELVRMQLVDFLHPSYRSIIERARSSNSWSQGFPPRTEWKILTKAGDERWLDVTLGNIELEGKPAWLLTAFDITDRDLAERELKKAKEELENRVAERTAELRSSNELMTSVYQAMADAVVVYNKDGVIIQANPAAVETYGFNPVGKSRFELMEYVTIRWADGTLIPEAETPFSKALRGETVSNDRIEVTNRRQETRSIVTYGSPIYVNGQQSGAVTVWRDLTAHENLLNRLEVEQARLDAVIRNAPVAILVADNEGRVVLSNPSTIQILGKAVEIGAPYQTLQNLGFCYPDGTPYDPRDVILTKAALDGESHTNIEMEICDDHGGRRFLLANATPILGSDGQLNGAIGVFQDITERRIRENEIQRYAMRAEVLASIHQIIAKAGLDIDDILSAIVHETTKSIADGAVIWMISEDRQWLEPAAFHFNDPAIREQFKESFLGNRFGINDSPIGQVVNSGKPLSVSSLQSIEEDVGSIPEFIETFDQFNIQDGAIVPMVGHSQMIGVFGVVRKGPNARITEDDLTFIHDLSDRSASAIENARLYKSTQQRAREMDALYSATSALIQTVDQQDLLSQILDAARNAIPSAEKGVLYLAVPDTGQLEIRAVNGYRDSRIKKISPRYGNHLVTWVVREKQPRIVHDWSGGDEPLESAIIAPLIMGDRAIGALCLTARNPTAFKESDLRLLTSFAATATAALQNASLHAELQKIAITDSLTSLLNRRGFLEIGEREVERAIRYRHPLSMIMMDIDHFKRVNDSYGHSVGDQILAGFAERCQSVLRHTDVMGRLGGDEFAILLPETGAETAVAVGERIKTIITMAPIPTDQGNINVQISAGIVTATQTQPIQKLSDLLSLADDRLYLAKRQGRGRIEVG